MDAAALSTQQLHARRVARLGATGDAWFKALDHARLTVGPCGYIVQVHGVHVSEGHIWLQLTAVEDEDVSFIVRVETGTTLENVMARLEALAAVPAPFEVIQVDSEPGSPRS
jgi:hypothetical protein